MERLEETFDLTRYLSMVWRRRYLFAGAFVIVLTGAILASYLMPKRYRASTIVLVESAPVVNPLNRDLSPARRDQENLKLIEHLLFNRASIENAIKKLGLDIPNPFKAERMIEEIRGNLYVRIKGNNIFEIGYTGEDPKVVRDLVNTLTSEYIEDTLSRKRTGSLLSLEFHNEQLLYYKKKLEEAEAALQRFKETHPDLLPREALLSKIQEFQLGLTDTKVRIKELEKKKALLLARLSNTRTGLDPDEDLTIAEKRLSELKKEFISLTTRYTENHPLVMKIKEEIRTLEKSLAGKKPNSKDVSPVAVDAIKGELEKIEAELSSLKVREKELNTKISGLQEKLSSSLEDEQELERLERDVKMYETIYNTLFSKLEEAKMTRELEKKEEAILFRVISPAVLPLIPAKPDRVLFILAGIVAGLAAGFAMVYVREVYLDPSFKGVEEVKHFIGYPILGVVPSILTDAERRRQRRKDLAVFAALSLYLVLVGVLLLKEILFRQGIVDMDAYLMGLLRNLWR